MECRLCWVQVNGKHTIYLRIKKIYHPFCWWHARMVQVIITLFCTCIILIQCIQARLISVLNLFYLNWKCDYRKCRELSESVLFYFIRFHLTGRKRRDFFLYWKQVGFFVIFDFKLDCTRVHQLPFPMKEKKSHHPLLEMKWNSMMKTGYLNDEFIKDIFCI